MNPLEAISPIDGRYRNTCLPLAGLFSEFGLHQYRTFVEIEYLIALSELQKVGIRQFTKREKKLLRNFPNIKLVDAELIKKIETKGYGKIRATNHDLKAVEYFIKHRLRNTSLANVVEWVHFGLTSENVNSVAYGLLTGEAVRSIFLPRLSLLHRRIRSFSQKYKNVAILGRTHGQPASPTTLGKEFKVFSARLERQIRQLQRQKILVAFSGATGNFNAHHSAYPNINWMRFSERFVDALNGKRKIVPITLNPVTTQVEPSDSYAELFDIFRRMNVILIDFCQDIWRYISDDWIVQRPVRGEIGSSTMPHKVNPIDFESAEGNLGLANSLFSFFSQKLPISRLQRDLSDSTVKRNFGVAFGHCMAAYECILEGLTKIEANRESIARALEDHPEVIAEAIQTILRREGIAMPYEKLKNLTRGKKVYLKDLHIFIDRLDTSDRVKNELKKIKPENYIGFADTL